MTAGLHTGNHVFLSGSRGSYPTEGRFANMLEQCMAANVASVAASALDLVGETPMVRLQKIDGRGGRRIFAKAEFLQPGGSVKDRAARAIVLAAQADGRLQQGQPIVEMTSGNMGAGLAVVAAALGHPLVLTMSAGNSPARVGMLEALGAKVVLVPQVDGSPGKVTGSDIFVATEVARAISDEQHGFYVDQFSADEGVRAHYETTGPEIWRQLGGRVDAWVAGVGTGATFLGTAAFLREQNPAIVCAAVEPMTARVLAGQAIRAPQHVLQGMGYGAVPPHWKAKLMDVAIGVTDEDAKAMKLRLAREEGLHVGYSAAANVCAAVALADYAALPADAHIVTVLCDTGLKY